MRNSLVLNIEIPGQAGNDRESTGQDGDSAWQDWDCVGCCPSNPWSPVTT